MRQKIIYIITFILFLLQVAFSIYYSNSIVAENQTISEYQKEFNQLQLDNQSLKIKFLDLSSLSVLEQYAASKSYTPIKNILK
jgi:Ca2+/Na+ antiporter